MYGVKITERMIEREYQERHKTGGGGGECIKTEFPLDEDTMTIQEFINEKQAACIQCMVTTTLFSYAFETTEH